MLDPKLEDELMKEIAKELGFLDSPLDTWIEDSIRTKISITMTRTYQEGQRDAFLAMGSFMKK